MNKTSSPMTAVVLGHDGKTVMSNGRATRILDGISPGALAGAGAFLDGCAHLFAGGLDGTVVTAHVPAAPWGPLDPAMDSAPADALSAFMQDARAAGWHCTDAALTHRSGWVTFTRADRPTVHLGVVDAMVTDPLLFGRGWTAEQICRQLAAYAGAVGVPFRTTAGITGCEVIRRYHETKATGPGGRRYMPTWVWEDGGAIMRDISLPGDIVWLRKLSKAERALPYVHVFDINKQYLSSMAAVEASWPKPEHHGADAFSADRAGIWHLLLPPGFRRSGAGKFLPPVINLGKVDGKGTVWVSTPIAAMLQRVGVPFEVLDSWTSPRVRHVASDGRELPGAGRWLREPAERIRDALTANPRPDGHDRRCVCQRCRLASTLKMTANAAVGMMAAPTSSLRRPDVAGLIRDHARAMLLMKLHKAWTDHRLSPARVLHDAVFYVSDSESPAALAAALGAVTTGQIGRFKYDRTLTMNEYMKEIAVRTAARERKRAQPAVAGMVPA